MKLSEYLRPFHPTPTTISFVYWIELSCVQNEIFRRCNCILWIMYVHMLSTCSLSFVSPYELSASTLYTLKYTTQSSSQRNSGRYEIPGSTIPHDALLFPQSWSCAYVSVRDCLNPVTSHRLVLLTGGSLAHMCYGNFRV